MGADILTTGINRSLFATADDELRPVMNGIYFDITTEDITLVASDGHKLVRNKTYAAHGEEKAAFILPKKPANLLKNLLPKEQGDVQIGFDDRNATFTLENYRMVCRLIEGRYPNYNSVIPQNNPHKAINRPRKLHQCPAPCFCLLITSQQPDQAEPVGKHDEDLGTGYRLLHICRRKPDLPIRRKCHEHRIQVVIPD